MANDDLSAIRSITISDRYDLTDLETANGPIHRELDNGVVLTASPTEDGNIAYSGKDKNGNFLSLHQLKLSGPDLPGAEAATLCYICYNDYDTQQSVCVRANCRGIYITQPPAP